MRTIKPTIVVHILLTVHVSKHRVVFKLVGLSVVIREQAGHRCLKGVIFYEAYYLCMVAVCVIIIYPHIHGTGLKGEFHRLKVSYN